MLTTLTGSIAIHTDTIPLSLCPGYQRPFSLIFTGIYKNPGLRRKPLDVVMSYWEYDGNSARVEGRPQYWATDEDNIVFNIRCDVAIPYYFKYYRELPNLAPAANLQTNFLTESYPTLIREVCTMKAYQFLKNDTEFKKARASAGVEIDQANQNADQELENTDFEMEIPGVHE